MFWLVESKDQIERFCQSGYKEAFVEIIPYNMEKKFSENNLISDN